MSESLSDRLRRYAVGSDNRVVMLEGADRIKALEEAFTELLAIAAEWDAESGRAEIFARKPALDPRQKERAMQRAMLLHHHAAAVEGCVARASR